MARTEPRPTILPSLKIAGRAKLRLSRVRPREAGTTARTEPRPTILPSLEIAGRAKLRLSRSFRARKRRLQPLPLPFASASNRSSGWNDRTFWDHHNPVSNVIIFAIDIARFSFGLYYDLVPDTGVFVDNGTLDNAMSSDAQRRTVGRRSRILTLVKIRAHQYRIADRRPAFDHAPDTDDRSLDMRIADDTAVSNDRVANLRAINFTSWQESRIGIDRVEVVKEVIGRNSIGQGQVRFIKARTVPMSSQYPNINETLCRVVEFVGASFFTMIVIKRIGADEFALGRMHQPFMTIRVITRLTKRIVRYDEEN